MNKDLPIYDIVIDETDLKQGVGMISLVDEPAIGVNWITLSKQEAQEIVFKAVSEKQLLYGPFLIPNKLIYRFDEKNGEYYVRFKADQIEKIADKFNESLNNKNINFQHTDEKVDAYVASNWIISGDQDKSKNFGYDLPEGTWFGGVKVKDQNFWSEKVKNNEVKGFSVEILADLELSLKNKEYIMEKQIKLGSALLQDGTTTIYFEGDTLAVGSAVFVDEAMTQPAPDGIHMTQDGDTIKVTEGKVEIYAPGLEFEGATLADYPWDQCIEDQMKQYGDKDIAEAVCGKIKSENMNEDLQVEPNSAQALTSEEVSLMIDSRFAELMDEITNLKTLLEEKDSAMTEYKKQVEERFSTTPAAQTITKKAEVKIEDKFAKLEARVREFAKVK